MEKRDAIPAIAGGKPVRDTKIFYGHQYLDEADYQAVLDVLKSDYLTCGPKIGELEEAILLAEFHLQKTGNRDVAEKAQQVSELDGKFHQVLYHASNSRILEHVLSDFHKYVKMARTMSVEESSRAEKSIEEHRAILDAIRSRDEDLAERLANEHVMKVMKNLHIEE